MSQTILLVEDEPKLAALLGDYLKAAGFTCEWHADGEQALAALRATPPDLVLLDLMLPGLDGLEVCRARWWPGSRPCCAAAARREPSPPPAACKWTPRPTRPASTASPWS